MAKAPGYQKNPRHCILTLPAEQTVRAYVGERLVAESNDVLRVDEQGHPVRHYFPRASVHTDLLERSDTTTTCPFKGQATYYTLDIGGKKLKDAVWSYEDPYEEHQVLRQHLAFYAEKYPEIEIRVG